MKKIIIKRRERDSILQSLRAGLVPKMGLHHIQVGRKHEITALISDLNRIEEGGAAFRFVIGRFGSGKTFFLNLVRNLALQKKIVVLQADLSMHRLIYSSSGKSQNLYSELMKNLAIKAKPQGNALQNICEGWISNIHHEIMSSGGSEEEVKNRISSDLSELRTFVGGYEFSQVLVKYYEGYLNGDDFLQSSALRWLRAEYTTKTEAKADLGVRRIIADKDIYDSLKLFAAFCVKAGYSGLLVNIDEMIVVSHRVPNSKTRNSNYESILTMINDCMQGNVNNIGFILAGTEEFLEDQRRGIYSYEALRTRLGESQLIKSDLIDLSGPVIKLQGLSQEELYVLLRNIRHVNACGEESNYSVPDEAIMEVLRKSSELLGAEYFRTPREVIKSFVQLLSLLEQNPDKKWQEILDITVTQNIKKSDKNKELHEFEL